MVNNVININKKNFLSLSLTLPLISACFSGATLAQTQILIGGALDVCTSTAPSNCVDGFVPQGKAGALYQIDAAGLTRINDTFPSQYAVFKNQVVKSLTALTGDTQYAEFALLQKWYGAYEQAQLLSPELLDFVLDSLEVAQTNTSTEKSEEQVYLRQSRSSASAELVSFITNALKVAAQQRKEPAHILVITASNRDPYANADYYEQLLASQGVSSEWLALTPALAQAINTRQCEALEAIRINHGVYDRQRVYPQRTKEEAALCKAGISALISKIKSATAVMFSGGDQRRAKRALFDANGVAYPWTEALRQRDVIVGTSAGSALQSGAKNNAGNVPMITAGESITALWQTSAQTESNSAQKLGYEAISYDAKGGLGSVDYGVIDTHFSERNRTLRLHQVVQESGQIAGYGIDETTALIAIISEQSRVATVLGQSGVVKIVPIEQNAFLYSYYPAGVRLTFVDNQWQLGLETQANDVKVPEGQSLPDKRFADILYDSKLRSLTQAMCLTAMSGAKAEQYAQGKYYDFSITRLPSTRFINTDTTNNACAIEGLKVQYEQRQ